MEKESKIAILGAGAIGCTLAARLILAGCEHVSLITRGESF
jgi:2-dehydropantoate 2-reductase